MLKRPIRITTLLILSVLTVLSAPSLANAGDVPTYDAAELGVFYHDWLLCGPFPNSFIERLVDYKHGQRCIGFERDYLESTGGEAAADPEEGDTVTVSDLGLERRWVLHQSEKDFIGFNDFFEPNDMVTAYGFCHIESAKRQRVMMGVGSNDGCKIWLNGELVHAFHIPDGRWLAADDDYVPVTLEKGVNRLLIEVDEGSGDYGFVFRLLDYEKTVTELRAKLDEHRHLSVVTTDDRLSIFFGTPHRVSALAGGKQVKIEVLDDEGKLVDTVSGDPGFEITIPIANVPEGFFSVRASLDLDSGSTAVSELRHFNGRLPRHGLPSLLGPDLAIRNDEGKPYFPIGTYGASVEKYEKLREAGYNFVVGGAPSLDAAQAAGLKMGLSVHGHGAEWLDQLRETVREHRDHPALLFWMLFDEPGYNRAELLEIHAAYELIHEEDPVHPIYLVITHPSVYETFGRCCDVLSIDTYPVSQGNLTSIGTNIDKAIHDLDGDQPIWHCGQLFDWPGDRYPTPREHRMMTYTALQAGVKGMMWFTYAWGGKELPVVEPELWKEHVQLMREMKELEPVLVYPGLGERLATGHSAVRATAKRGPNGESIIFAVNTSETETIASRIQLPSTLSGEIEVMRENRGVAVKNGLLRDRFAPLDVHVYVLKAEG